MPQSFRYLSLAFVASDLLLEIDAARCVRFSAGASACLQDDARTYNGRLLDDMLGRASAWELRQTLAALPAGQRIAPVSVLVRCGKNHVRKATVRAFSAPELAPAISLGLTWDGAAFALPGVTPPLLACDAFLERARASLEHARERLSVDFVEIPGLSCPPGIDAVAAALQDCSMDGQSAAQLSGERFAVLRAGDDPSRLGETLRRAGAVSDIEMSPVVQTADLGQGTESMAALRALRFAIEGCLADGPSAPAETFSSRLAQTLRDADQFRRISKNRDFQIHFQPIVDLATGAVHHHEALARFGSRDTAETIRMAEEMDLIRAFDLAVLEKVLRALRQPGAGLAKLAVNVSGASLGSDDFIETLLRRTAAEPSDRRRIMIEVTETAALKDMDGARARLDRLRAAGIKVCIDDFGAGAASYEYLRTLPVDIIKLDGSITRSVADDPRSRAMVEHLVALCRSLGVGVVAEQVETDDHTETLRKLGVDMAQGWRFGRPTPELVTRIADEPAARRKGAVHAWG
jgi:EAL domain-containing protein (putative c-di-GMP-specific phosphodiesterase class I)